MTTPNADLGAMPTMRSYADTTTNAGGYARLQPGNFYLRLPEGVSTIMLASQGSALSAYLTTERNTTSRYTTAKADAGKSVVFSNVGVPVGAERYLSVQLDKPGDVGATIITYPPA